MIKANNIITTNESLWNKVAHQRMLELTAQAESGYTIESENSFGKFLFVTLLIDGLIYEFYGAGYHDHKEEYIHDRWYIVHLATPLTKWEQDKMCLDWNTNTNMYWEYIDQKNETAKMHHQERVESGEHRSDNARIFASLAELGDEDGALGLMEDFGISM